MAIEEYEEETTIVRDRPDDARGTVVKSRITDDLPPGGRRFGIVYYIMNIIEALLLIRFALKLFAANPGAGFVNGIYAITDPLVAPFRGIFPTANSQGSVLEWSTIIAMIVYALIAYAIVQLLKLTTSRSRVV